MTQFEDGPAKGQVLMLKRSPRFLRVTFDGKSWDALDNPSDTPMPVERLWCYQLSRDLGTAHINRGSKGGLFCKISEYVMALNPPTDEIMRSSEAWQQWCRERSPE